MRKKRLRILNWVLGSLALVLALITAGLLIVSVPYFTEDPHLLETEAPEVPSDTQPPETEATEPPLDPNPYGRLDFQYDSNNYLKLIHGESVTGIDVSSYQKDIDFDTVKASGVDFVIVRMAYRGYETGKIVFDKDAHHNLAAALNAGLDVGVYFFSQAITPEEAEEEALFLLEAIKDYEITMPVVYDWEHVSAEDARTADMDPQTLTSCCKVFCQTVEEAGYWPMVYFNRRQAQYHMDITQLKDYDFWLAAYTDRMDFPYKIKMWQYTNTGTVPGISVDVDINVFFPET